MTHHEICELCGDQISSEDACEIDSLASDYFMLDTGTTVHKQCFDDSRPTEYLRKLRDLEKEEETFQVHDFIELI